MEQAHWPLLAAAAAPPPHCLRLAAPWLLVLLLPVLRLVVHLCMASLASCNHQHLLDVIQGGGPMCRYATVHMRLGWANVSTHNCWMQEPYCLTCCFSCSSLLFPIDGFLVGLL